MLNATLRFDSDEISFSNRMTLHQIWEYLDKKYCSGNDEDLESKDEKLTGQSTKEE
jgi:hypothetical protein